MAGRTPAGFHTNGVHRPNTTGRKVALAPRKPLVGWPYGVACPSCDAKRYERCFKIVRSAIIKGVRIGSDFIYIKDTPCAGRVKLVTQDDIGEDNEGTNGE